MGAGIRTLGPEVRDHGRGGCFTVSPRYETRSHVWRPRSYCWTRVSVALCRHRPIRQGTSSIRAPSPGSRRTGEQALVGRQPPDDDLRWLPAPGVSTDRAKPQRSRKSTETRWSRADAHRAGVRRTALFELVVIRVTSRRRPRSYLPAFECHAGIASTPTPASMRGDAATVTLVSHQAACRPRCGNASGERRAETG